MVLCAVLNAIQCRSINGVQDMQGFRAVISERENVIPDDLMLQNSTADFLEGLPQCAQEDVGDISGVS